MSPSKEEKTYTYAELLDTAIKISKTIEEQIKQLKGNYFDNAERSPYNRLISTVIDGCADVARGRKEAATEMLLEYYGKRNK